MAGNVPARLSPALGRRFGLAVGGVFLLLGALFLWRGRAAGPVLLGIGAVLLLGGLVIPRAMVPVYRAWMGLGLLLSRVVSPVVVGLLFFLIVTPIGAALRLAGRRPIPGRGQARARWMEKAAPADPRASMERQF